MQARSARSSSSSDRTATDCALIDRSRLVFQDRLARLSETAPVLIAVESDKPARLAKRFLEDGVHADREGAVVRAQLDIDAGARAGLVSALVSEGYAVSGIWTERPGLEAVFLKLTGRGREMHP